MAQLQHRRIPHTGNIGRSSRTHNYDVNDLDETKSASARSFNLHPRTRWSANTSILFGKKTVVLGICMVYFIWKASKSPFHDSVAYYNNNPATIVRDTTQAALGSLYDPPQSQSLDDPRVREAFGPRAICLRAIRHRHDQVFGAQLQQLFSSQSKSHHSQHYSSLEILLIDPAYHPNVGDHMITVGEQVFLQKLISNWTRHYFHGESNKNTPLSSSSSVVRYKECSYLQARNYSPPCTQVISAVSTSPTTSNTPSLRVAFWHGGGNWGDLWPKIQQLRTASLPLLANFTTIMGMPQSLYFAHAERQAENAQQWNSHVASTSQTSLWTWREHESWQLAQKLYPRVQHQLVPDIAFQLGPYLRTNNSKSNDKEENDVAPVDILFLLRNDHESIHSPYRDRRAMTELLNQLSEMSPDHHSTRRQRRISFSIVDWPDRLDRFSSTDEPDPNFLFTETAVKLLRMGRVVICDRLHAAILAYLCGQSLVFVDQISGKLTKTLRVAMESDPLSCHADEWANASHARSRNQPAWWARGHNLTHAIQTAMEILSVV